MAVVIGDLVFLTKAFVLCRHTEDSNSISGANEMSVGRLDSDHYGNTQHELPGQSAGFS